MKSMMLCNTVVAILALVGTGLISAGLVLLLMSLGLPDKPVSYRWKDSKENLSKENEKILLRAEEIMEENRRFR